MTKEKFFGGMGWAGMVTSILMYVFYFPQILNNLDGHKGTFIQPFMAGINCTLWVCYGFFKEKRDWPLVIANVPGIIFGTVMQDRPQVSAWQETNRRYTFVIF